ncbi:MAG: MFS transporter [Proteobacteria bacterium]|nr:MFS transporter [Pseudomonadota bacterium]MBU4130150.1 MFS transporter [Pseudomonadota bacterium]
MGAGILSAFQVGKVPPVLQDIRADLCISLFHAGWVLSAFNLIGLVLGTAAGAIADALGHRRLMLFGIGLQIAGSFLGAFSPSFEWLLATRFLEGAGFLAVIVSTPTLIFQVVQKKDVGIALSVWSCYLPAGAALMMVLLPLYLKLTTWQGIWQINGVLLSLYAILLAKATSKILFMNQTYPLKPSRLWADIIKTVSSPGPLLLGAIFTTYALQWLAVMGFLPTLLLEKYGFSRTLASWLTAGMVFLNIFGNLAGGRLLRNGFKRWLLIGTASFVMGTCAVAIYAPGAHFMLNYTGCLLFSLAGGLIPASVIGAAPIYAPSKNLVSTTTGLVIQGGQTGQVIGPPMLAWLVSFTGTWTAGAWFLGGVALTGILLSIGMACLKDLD